MKKNLLAILGFCTILLAVSCSKGDNGYGGGGGTSNASIEGKWTGNYNNGIGGPLNYLALTFKTGGSLTVEANNSSGPDIANGTWYMAADSVRATFTYVSGGATGTYSIAGKYTAGATIMNGTMGIGTNTSGAFLFSVVRDK